MKPDNRKHLIAALTWDRPTLAKVNSPAAQAFLRTLSGDLPVELPEDGTSDQTDTLLVAAMGLARALQGETEEGKRLFQSLTRRRGLAEFMGWNLLAWFSEAPETPLARAERIIRRQQDPRLRSRMWCKLTALALDAGRREDAWNFIVEATKDAPPSTRLGAQIRISALNEFGAFSDEITMTSDRDELADLPWVMQAAGDAATEAMAENVIARAERASWMTFRYGITVVDRIAAAERQATWAGALWHRRKLRLQLAATLLLGGAESSEQWTYASALWVLGGGKRPDDVIDFAEVNFEPDSGDTLLNDYLKFYGKGPWEADTYTKVLGATWDLVSVDTAARLLREMEIPAALDPLSEGRQQIFAALVLRAASPWFQRFRSLDEGQQLAIASAMSPDVVSRLTKRTAQHLLGILSREGAQEVGNFRYFLNLAALHSQAGSARAAAALVSDAPPLALPDIVGRYPGIIPPEKISEAIGALSIQVQEALRSAENGNWSFGGRSPRQALGFLAAHSTSKDQSAALSTLSQVLSSQGAPRDMKVEAAFGLWSIAEAEGLPRALRAKLRGGEVLRTGWNFDVGTPPELLEAAILGALAPNGLTINERDRLVARSRHPHANVRRTAVRAAAMLAEDAATTPVLQAGLFDPNEEVQRAALSALASKRIHFPGLAERLHSLFATGSRHIRADVVATCRKLGPSERRHPAVKRVMADARNDRSFIVRDVLRSIRRGQESR